MPLKNRFHAKTLKIMARDKVLIRFKVSIMKHVFFWLYPVICLLLYYTVICFNTFALFCIHMLNKKKINGFWLLNRLFFSLKEFSRIALNLVHNPALGIWRAQKMMIHYKQSSSELVTNCTNYRFKEIHRNISRFGTLVSIIMDQGTQFDCLIECSKN